jgi:amino acid adenylation domain-containing protein
MSEVSTPSDSILPLPHPVPRDAAHGEDTEADDSDEASAEDGAGATDRPTSDQVAIPLSVRQGLMWMDEQLFPDARYHNLPVVIELEGALDVERLLRAWQATVAAHDSLRVAIDRRSPQQTFTDAQAPLPPVITLPFERVRPWIAERCSHRLNQGGFMWDAALLEVSPREHVFYVCQDHSIADGMSQWVLLQDLAERYSGRTPAPVASFAEYLRAEATYLRTQKARDDKAYWDKKLASSTAPLRPYGILRTDRSVALDRVWHDAGAELARTLEARAADAAFASWSGPLSRLVVLATATAAFMYRVTGNREVVLAVPFANRQPRFARTHGLLMQQLFLRIEVREGDTFASLAETVKAELVQSIRHGQACVSSRGIDYVTLNLLPAPPTEFGDLRATLRLDPAPTRAGAGAGYGDLRDTLGIQVYDFADGARPLEIGFDFHAATYDADAQRRMRRHFVRVLEALAADGETVVDRCPLLDADERAQVLRLGRGAEPPAPPPDPIARFAAQVEERADHVAVQGPDATLTYAELDAASNRLAHRLRSLGVKRESRVGVAVPRSAAELVALLATLKAGGAYVPVDPTHPVDRVRVILEDAAPEVLIAPSDSPLIAALPPATALLPFDDVAGGTSGWDAGPIDEAPRPEQLAYILFTSGSTGRPKGVQIPRGAFANFLRSFAREPGLTRSDRLLAITTTTFDIAGLELFLPLWVGASVVVADRDSALDPRRLRALLERGGFTAMQATPATWRMLVDAGWQGDERLRMFIGGEALSPELAQALLARGAELWNLYGPTETTVYSTIDRVPRDEKRITVGRPIDNTQIYILDAALSPVPAGVIGEIYIGGDGVARGYHGREDLTAQRFVPDPFAGAGKRMYRTGDCGRWLGDGRVECLGRIDSQVKIRGFRVELGEIESVLRAVPDVQEAVVVARASGSLEAKLVAYWVGGAPRAALFDHARAKLPHYMVPTAYVQLAAFPLTTSGKIDRKMLPAAEDFEAQDAVELRLPEGDTARRVAAIWSELLKVAPIGADQDFFALGGTSVLVIEVRNHVEREFGVELPLRAFFDTPTVEGIARQIEQLVTPSEADAPTSCLVRLKPRGGAQCLFLIHDGDGEVLLYRNLALQMPDEISVYGVVPLPGRGVPMVHTSVGDMADHYVREIRSRQPSGPYYLSGLCAGGVIAFEVARRLMLLGDRVGLLALIDSGAPRVKMKPLRISRDRAARLRGLLGEVRSRGPREVAREARQRAQNVVEYEIGAVQDKLRAAALVFVFEHFYAGGAEPWPKQLPAPSVRDIYLRALARYSGSPISGVPAVLFRATEGQGADLPIRDVVDDPFFGWRELLGDDIEVIDVEGGHSTVLQEGRVETIAHRLRAVLNRARRAQSVHPPPVQAQAGSLPPPSAAPAHKRDGGTPAPIPGPRRSVTIVTVSYKTAALVTRLMISLAEERRRYAEWLDVRFIVVDNSSIDAEPLRAAIAEHEFGSWTTLIAAERNGGFSYGNNVGFAHAYASGQVPDFFFLLNPDTEARPGAVGELVRFMVEHPDAGIAGGSLENEHGELWPYAFRFPSLLSEVEYALGVGLVTRFLKDKVVARRMEGVEPEEVDWIPGASFMLRREVIDRLGGMDESYFLYYEETDFCRKVKEAGWTIWYVPESRVMHVAGQSTGVTTVRARARRLPGYWFESRRRYFAKHHGVPYAIATDVATFFASALGRSKLILQGQGARAVPYYLFDLARHSPLRPQNRELGPTREFQNGKQAVADAAPSWTRAG